MMSAPLKRRRRDAEAVSPFMVAMLGLCLAILFIPLVIIILLSFNASPYGTFPFEGTLKWYVALFTTSNLLGPTLAVARNLGARRPQRRAVRHDGGGVARPARLSPRRRRVSHRASQRPHGALADPWPRDASGDERDRSRPQPRSIYLGLLATTLPYVVFIVSARLQSLDRDLDHAARSLGASPLTSFLRISAPLLLPSIVSGTLIAFIVSFNNFLIQYFLAPFGVQTLP